MSTPSTRSLTPAERATLRRLLRALQEFRKLRPTMPLQHALAALCVAIDEGKNVSEYASQCDLPHSSMSRHLLDIGSMQREGRAGLGLVQLDFAPEDRRTHIAKLTPRGAKFARTLIQALKGGENNAEGL